MYKIAYFVTHPIQYQVPLLRMLSQHPAISLRVFFLCDVGMRQHFDYGFGITKEWDEDLRHGYDSVVLPNFTYADRITTCSPIALGILAALRGGNWDAIWVHGYGNISLMSVIMVASMLNIPLMFRGESSLSCTSKGVIKDCLIRRLVRQSAALLYIGAANKEYYRYYGAKEEQLFFTPYAVDNEFFETRCLQMRNTVQFRAHEFNAGENDIVFLFIGKLIPRKQAVELLHAYARFCTNSTTSQRTRLVYVGDGEERKRLEAEIKLLGLASQVKLLGFRNQHEIPLYLKACDYFVMPSLKEPFGLILNEALCCAKPALVSSEVMGARDLVEDGYNGFCVEAGNLTEWRRAFERALESMPQAPLMGERSSQRIKSWGFKEDVQGIEAALNWISSRRKCIDSLS